uniref:Uncharacterized protein n=1 Tax=Picea glauca TaxID=3330 RepID=A0A101LYH7_PICGL|nr:hypothetical protein ABT39_MTgene5869 [Picea glauca]
MRLEPLEGDMRRLEPLEGGQEAMRLEPNEGYAKST